MFYIPKKEPKKAALASVILIMLAAMMFLISNFLPPRLIYQLIGAIFASVGIFFATRYMLTDYKYVITDIERPGDEVKFTIVKINGKREAIMANFNLIDAYAIEKCKKISQFEKKHGKVNKFYGYTSNFSSPDTYMLAINFNQMKILFAIELNDSFAAELKNRLTFNSDTN
jgi:hypothetical protein